jgi:hypothetical protein
MKLGELREKHPIKSWTLGTVSMFARRQRKTKRTCVEMAEFGTYRMHTDLYLASKKYYLV